MKKLLLLLKVSAICCFSCICFGCERPIKDSSVPEGVRVRVPYYNGYTYAYVITVDGCDYVAINDSRGVALVHKANCKCHEK